MTKTYYRHEIQEEIGKLLNAEGEYDIFVVKDLDNKLIKIMIKSVGAE